MGIPKHDNFAVPGARFSDVVSQLNNFNDNDTIFVACGINDCAGKVDLSEMRTTIAQICNYFNTNHPTIPVYFILPIKTGGAYYPKLPIYVNAIAEAVLENDTFNHFSLINGYNFNFPDFDAPTAFIKKVFQGASNVHPNEYGIKNIYVPSLAQILG